MERTREVTFEALEPVFSEDQVYSVLADGEVVGQLVVRDGEPTLQRAVNGRLRPVIAHEEVMEAAQEKGLF